MKLNELKRGEKARIIKIGKIGELKKRLVDMAITGETILEETHLLETAGISY